jgi:diadenosine tetraphosphate (Ap4A) HIT family hydrolase
VDIQPGCRFCLANNLLVDQPIFMTDSFYMLGSIDPMLPVAGMIVPRGHSENPFEMASDEWAGFADALSRAKAHFADRQPDGFTLGWNVGAVAGQHVFHTHCHIIPRFKGEPNEGVGIRRVLRTAQWAADA